MNTAPKTSSKSKAELILRTSLIAVLAVCIGLAAVKILRSNSQEENRVATIIPTAVSRTNLVLLNGRLCLLGQTNAFNGIMIEPGRNGSLLSRSSVTNGVLHGLSEGWHTNGQLQVTEYFKNGVSHGLRTKWHPNGVKHVEVPIVEGKLHGTFRRWHDNGQLSEQVEFVADRPQGTSLAYFPSGFLKARVALHNGKATGQQFWKDGEFRE